MSHVETVQRIYQSFGKGDIPAILERIASDVEWEHDYVDQGIPYIKPGRGKAHVVGFFEVVGRDLAFQKFDVVNLMGNGDQVVAILSVEATYKPTGKSFRDYEVHVWTLDAGGLVTRFRHLVDTAQHIAATRG